MIFLERHDASQEKNIQVETSGIWSWDAMDADMRREQKATINCMFDSGKPNISFMVKSKNQLPVVWACKCKYIIAKWIQVNWKGNEMIHMFSQIDICNAPNIQSNSNYTRTNKQKIEIMF